MNKTEDFMREDLKQKLIAEGFRPFEQMSYQEYEPYQNVILCYFPMTRNTLSISGK